MLGMKTYKKDYIDACRARVDANVRAYKKQAGKDPKEFEWRYFNDQVLLLDYMFVHRLSGVEGKDGNPLNEVRMISGSLMQSGGVMTPEKSIRMKPAVTVVKYEFGDDINVTESDYARLAEAFFAEIETKYP